MTKTLFATGALLLLSVTTAFAHRIDEYLQATTILVSKNRLQAELRLSPGTAVASTVLDSIDTNHDNTISEPEQRAYADRVVRDLSFSLDEQALQANAVAWRFSSVARLREGTGEIQVDIEASLPNGARDRTLTFENRHRSAIGAYLVNSLMPQDSTIQIVNQKRNYVQSTYELTYVQSDVGARSVSFGVLMRWVLAGGAILVVLAQAILSRRRRVITS